MLPSALGDRLHVHDIISWARRCALVAAVASSSELQHPWPSAIKGSAASRKLLSCGVESAFLGGSVFCEPLPNTQVGIPATVMMTHGATYWAMLPGNQVILAQTFSSHSSETTQMKWWLKRYCTTSTGKNMSNVFKHHCLANWPVYHYPENHDMLSATTAQNFPDGLLT